VHCDKILQHKEKIAHFSI